VERLPLRRDADPPGSAASPNRAEQALLDSEARLRGIVDTAVDGILTIDEAGTVEWVNPAALRIFGYTAEELIGRNVKMIMPEPYRSEHDRYLESYRRTGERKIIGHGREVMGLRKDSSTFPVDLAVSEVYLGDRRIFTGIVRDVTERKRAEEALRDSEARIKAIVDTAVDGIITIDEQGNIEWLNPAALRTFGYTGEELLGKNVKVLMPEPYHSQHDGYLDNYRRTGIKKIIGSGREVIGLRKDGSTFPMELAVSEVPLGNRRLFTGIVRNISERKEVEEDLRRAKEAAEAANKAKDHFLAVVSHELRTPLNPILTTASFLETSREVPPELREHIVTIRRNVEQEARIVDDLLNLTRLQRNKIELHFEAIDAHGAVRNALAQFQQEIDAKNIGVFIALRAKQHHVWADPGRIQQVLSNLLSNAVKFTPEGGQLTLRSSNTPDAKLRLEVSDAGIGIEADMLPRLFSPFEQGERTRSRKYGGLGLGLVISKGIMDLHGGALTASSEGRDKGATFALELATVPPVEEPRPPVPNEPQHLGRCSILLVEDHADTLMIMTQVLKRLGFSVITAKSVGEALDAAATSKFDLLVSDIGLPDGSGLDIMRMVREKYGVRGIALSGFGQEEDVVRSRDAGFAEHLVKPVDFQRLERVIRRVTAVN
jgi:PAS domain S-box-containing protein